MTTTDPNARRRQALRPPSTWAARSWFRCLWPWYHLMYRLRPEVAAAVTFRTFYLMFLLGGIVIGFAFGTGFVTHHQTLISGLFVIITAGVLLHGIRQADRRAIEERKVARDAIQSNEDQERHRLEIEHLDGVVGVLQVLRGAATVEQQRHEFALKESSPLKRTLDDVRYGHFNPSIAPILQPPPATLLTVRPEHLGRVSLDIVEHTMFYIRLFEVERQTARAIQQTWRGDRALLYRYLEDLLTCQEKQNSSLSKLKKAIDAQRLPDRNKLLGLRGQPEEEEERPVASAE